jgi:hypothetical protein
LKYDFEMSSSSKDLMYSRKIEQMKHELKVELGAQFEEESKLHLSQQLEERKREMEAENKHKLAVFELTIAELKKSIGLLTSEN